MAVDRLLTLISLLAAAAAAAAVVRSQQRKGRRNSNGKKRPLAELVRSNIQDLTPYRCARDDYSSGVLIDANENGFGPCLESELLNVDVSALELNRYPDPYQADVKALLASLRNVRPEQIFVGVGSDEAIDLLIRIFCQPGHDTILCTPPTYGMYKVCAKVNDVAVQNVPLTPEFDVVVPAVLKAVTPNTKMIFLCSPGNPTAKAVPLAVVREIFAGGYDGIVVMDEAYIDFSQGESAVTLIDELDRLVVLQTMSKAFGLAAIRTGMAYGNPEIIQYMNNVKAPYNVNRLSQEVAVKALGNLSLYRERVKQILSERDRLMKELRGLSFIKRVLYSDANFFLFQLDNAHTVYKHMAENGVVVRYRGSELHCQDCIRVTVGTPEENEKFLDLLKQTVAGVQNGTIAIR